MNQDTNASASGELSAKNAKLTLKLRADSGYQADQEARISAEQWGKICRVIEGTELASAPAAQAATGFTLLPIQPTPEMIEAGNNVSDLYRMGKPELWGQVYRAMVRAAPHALAALQQRPAPASPTFMTSEQALKWAWQAVREDVGTEGWTAGDSGNYYGFFLFGWNYREQYEKQLRAAQAEAAPAPTAKEFFDEARRLGCKLSPETCAELLAPAPTAGIPRRAWSKESEMMESWANVGQAEAAAPVAKIANQFLMSQDLYSLLMDIQNGIDSPATCGLANRLIVRLDKVRDALAAGAAEATDDEWDRNAERLTIAAGLGGGRINPDATSILDIFIDDDDAAPAAALPAAPELPPLPEPDHYDTQMRRPAWSESLVQSYAREYGKACASAAVSDEQAKFEAAAYRLWRDCEISEDAWFMEHIADHLPRESFNRAPTAAEWDAAMAAVMRDRAALADPQPQQKEGKA